MSVGERPKVFSRVNAHTSSHVVVLANKGLRYVTGVRHLEVAYFPLKLITEFLVKLYVNEALNCDVNSTVLNVTGIFIERSNGRPV